MLNLTTAYQTSGWKFSLYWYAQYFFSWQQNKFRLPWKYICISAQSVRNTKLIVVEEPSPQIALLSFVRYRYNLYDTAISYRYNLPL